jgi:hypothetical protein
MQQFRRRKHIINNSGAFVLGCLRLYQVRFQLQIYQAVIIIIIIIMSYRSFLAVKIRNDSKYFGIVVDQISEENKWTCEEELIQNWKELRLTNLLNSVLLNFALY